MSRFDSMAHVERLVLHTAMHRSSALQDMPLRPEHFANEQHAELWELIERQSQDGLPGDCISLGEYAERIGRAKLGVLAIDIGCAGDLFPASNAGHFAGVMLEAWRGREAARIASELADGAKRRDEGAIDTAIAALMALHSHDRQCEFTAQQALSLAWDQVNAAHLAGGALIGVPTGLAGLDEALGGLHDSDLIVVGARPAMGKTGLLLQMVDAASQAGPVGLVSGEQPVEQVGLRWLANGSRVSVGRLRNASIEEHEWSAISSAVKAWRERPIRIYDRSAPDVADVARVARRWKHQYGIKALYVDYLQRLEMRAAGDAPKHERVGAIARALKNLARELGIPVVTLAQVSRKVEDRQNQRPTMADLSDSSEIEKEADQVMTLWRDTSDPKAKRQPAEIIVCKNRHGNIGAVECVWMGEQTRFADAQGGA